MWPQREHPTCTLLGCWTLWVARWLCQRASMRAAPWGGGGGACRAGRTTTAAAPAPVTCPRGRCAPGRSMGIGWLRICSRVRRAGRSVPQVVELKRSPRPQTQLRKAHALQHGICTATLCCGDGGCLAKVHRTAETLAVWCCTLGYAIALVLDVCSTHRAPQRLMFIYTCPEQF